MSADDRPAWIDSGRVPSLDGLRAVAILWVVLGHAYQTRGFPPIGVLRSLGSVGPIGVEIFFVLSGFLITTLILREIEGRGRFDARAFYRRRALRILPAYACFLAAVMVLQLAGGADLGPSDWIAAATFTMNFRWHPAWEVGHVWSLSIEEHFYLLWPLAVLTMPRRLHVVPLVGCLAACLAGRWIVLLAFPAKAAMAELWTFTRLDTIAAGCLLAIVARRTVWRTQLDRTVRWWPAVGIVLSASLVLARMSAGWSVGVAYSLNSACIALLVWAAVQKSPRWLNGRAMVAIGIGSYSLYLWQQVFLNPHRHGWPTGFPQNLLLAGLATLASYRIVETPFLRLKERPARGRGSERLAG